MAHANIILVGPMGAGKSTIGRLLADQLGLEFVDIDREIESRAGVDIPWIFDKEGEAGFRERESSVLHSLLERDGVLIATGGGAILREDNRRIMRSAGTVVYLHATVDEQVRRTARDRRRPLLQNNNPREVLASLMTVRDPLYRDTADIVVDTDGRSPKVAATEIARLLNR